MKNSIDLNCDMGESFGAYHLGQDEALMDFVSSVNIACGYHAGDAATMRKTVALAVKKNVAIGAHPGYPDLQGFGRRAMDFSPDEIYELIVYQVGALAGFASAAGASLHHVKPHGALYNLAAKNASIAHSIAHAVRDIDPSLVLVGLSGSYLITEAESAGLQTASEVFADRSYQDDGSLTPRKNRGALIENADHAASQVLQMIQEGVVTSVSGQRTKVKAESVCIHGDSPHALTFANSIRNLLLQHGIQIQRP